MYTSFYTPNADFQVWSAQHWGWLAYAVLSTIAWIYVGRKAATPEAQQRIGFFMCLVGVASWVWAEVLMARYGQWNTQSAWPLHLCYFLNLVLPFMVLRRSFWFFDVVYPVTMAGCLQALFTPDLNSGFPHFHNVRYFLVHTALVQSTLYCIFVFRFRPTAQGILKCMVFFNIYALIVSVFNWALDTNFMYLKEKPPGTMLDWFGEWPWYIIGGEVLALALFTLAWLPFYRKRG
jgi:hypothetical integral membrane protein (TIGR02206 family)